jgi:opacity protein-like surface antigen
MLRSLIALTLATILTLASARAGDPKDGKGCHLFLPEEGVGLYAGIFGGANLAQSGDRDNPAHADSRDFVSNVGWFSGLKLGYAFKPAGLLQPAAEIEAYYNRVNFQSFTHNERGPIETKADTNANQQTLALMLNGIVRIDLGRFRPYVGAGVGAAHVWLTEHSETDQFSDSFTGFHDKRVLHFGDRDEFSFAAQGIAGAEFLVTSRIGVFAEYKALYVRDSMLVKNYISHLLGGGVRVYF